MQAPAAKQAEPRVKTEPRVKPERRARRDEPHAKQGEPHARRGERRASEDEPRAKQQEEPRASADEPHAGVDERRLRLFEGFGAAVAERGYAAATIADIVRHARVSKRTFYEHFPDKEACLLARYESITADIRERMRRAFVASEGRGWPEQLDAVLDAYVTALEADPSLTRTCLVEMAAAGPRAMRLRREVHEAFAALLRDLVDHARARDPSVCAISAPLATALVGGIDELLLAQVERGPRHRLADLRRTAADLLHAVLTRSRGAQSA